MKAALALASLLISAHAFAFTCQYKGPNNTGFDTATITATVDGSDLTNISVSVLDSEDDFTKEQANGVGERISEVPYKRAGSKYAADYYRYELSDLKDAKTGQAYDPGSMCDLELHIPKTIAGKFSAPLVVHCEQNGGTMHMSCE